MRITTEQLAQHLERSLAPLYIVHGDEPLLALEAADRIRARAREEGHVEREVLTAEQHFDWSQLRVSGQSQSLFATRRILEIRIPSGKPGNDVSTEALTRGGIEAISWLAMRRRTDPAARAITEAQARHAAARSLWALLLDIRPGVKTCST